MEKLVLVTHDKNQGLLGAQSTKLSMPDSMTIKIKNMPKPLPAKRDTPKSKRRGLLCDFIQSRTGSNSERNKTYCIPEMTRPCTKEKNDTVL